MDRMEKKIDENNKLLSRLTMKKRGGIKGAPLFLPFKTVEDLENFDNADNDTFDELVDYLVYLGGINAVDCAAIYFKNCFHIEEEISPKVSWVGLKNVKSLSKSRFADACEESMKLNINLNEQRLPEFIDGMTKALKSLKERRRKRCLRLPNIGQQTQPIQFEEENQEEDYPSIDKEYPPIDEEYPPIDEEREEYSTIKEVDTRQENQEEFHNEFALDDQRLLQDLEQQQMGSSENQPLQKQTTKRKQSTQPFWEKDWESDENISELYPNIPELSKRQKIIEDDEATVIADNYTLEEDEESRASLSPLSMDPNAFQNSDYE